MCAKFELFFCKIGSVFQRNEVYTFLYFSWWFKHYSNIITQDVGRCVSILCISIYYCGYRYFSLLFWTHLYPEKVQYDESAPKRGPARPHSTKYRSYTSAKELLKLVEVVDLKEQEGVFDLF